jgi:RHS repeat-associated protein
MKKMTALTVTATLLNLYRSCGIILLLSLLLAGSASAQSGTSSSTHSGTAPGAAAGSYRLSDFDSVNVYNGNVSLHLPLLSIGGRGGAQTTLMVSGNNPKWSVSHTTSCGDCDTYLATPKKFPSGGGGGQLGPGIFKVSRAGNGTVSDNPGIYATSLTRVKFLAPDGTEYELRDKLSQGKPYSYAGTNFQPFNRGSVFVSADGTAATFISTNASGTIPVNIYDDHTTLDSNDDPVYIYGYLLLSNGTRYWIQSTTGDNPTTQIRWMRDRNGNLLTFAYDGLNLVEIKDSLNRVINISYAPYVVSDNTYYSPSTTITYTGFDGTPRTITIKRTQLSDQTLRSDYPAMRTYGQLFPELVPYWDIRDGQYGVPEKGDYYKPVVTKEILLPDGRSYQLRYNPYGELARVQLPTGGAVEYDYTEGSGVVFASDAQSAEIYRRVKRRVVKARRLLTDAEVEEQATNYGDPVVTGYDLSNAQNSAPVTEVTVKSTASLVKHHFYGDPIYYRGGQNATSYQRWNEGREYLTEVYTPNGATLLRKMENTWRNRAHVSWWTGSDNQEPPNDPLLVETVTTLADNGTSATTHLVTKRSSINPQTGALAYDAYCNQTDVWEYDYDEGAPGPLVRHTHTDYLTSNTHQDSRNYAVFDDVNDIHIRNLPTTQKVFQVINGGEVEQARLSYEYDKYGGDNNHAALVGRSAISGHDADFSAAYQTRGNLTAITRWLLPNQQIKTYQQYDVAGNPVKAIDALGNATFFSYTDNFGQPDGAAQTSESPLPTELGTQRSYAFVTRVTNALGPTYAQYNYHTGVAVDTEDLHGVVTSAYYGGALDRPTKVISDANNQVAKQQTSFVYVDSSHLIRVLSDLNTYDDKKLKSETIYDGLGRTFETRSSFLTATNYLRVDTLYDGLGRVSQTSNPYRPELQETALWTTTSYDALGRVISVKTPDNAAMKTVYKGNTVTVTDQAGKARQSTTDALGRLTKVVEAPTVSELKYETLYSYDALDNMLSVDQGDQERNYVYDSLSQLIEASNPENGTMTYEYDLNGNLKKRTDERQISATSQIKVTMTCTYDDLNRIKSKSYNDGTPNVAYFYDAEALPTGAPVYTRGATTGRLVAVTYGGTSAGTYFAYDKLGRVTKSVQRTDAENYAITYQYSLTGALTAETYPSGRVVRTAYDGLGRLSSVKGEKGGTTKTYASSYGYTSQGLLSKVKLGNGLWEHTTYDPKRLQVKEIGLGISSADSSYLKLTYGYGTAAANNGNVATHSITAPGLSVTQSFLYDELNRLETATEKKGTVIQWRQGFAYDRYGNRRLDLSVTTPAPQPGQNPLINPANNQISSAGVQSSVQYDLVGNMTRDNAGYGYQYDAESRLVGFSATSSVYSYDGAGQRVKKVVGTGSLAVKTIFVYDAGGSLVAEYATNTVGSASGTSYLTLDRLGSTRIVTNGVIAAGGPNIKARYDYQPFGEEVSASHGNRSNVAGYAASETTRQKYTGYERDVESGLDFAQARYYANKQGRFTSADSVGGTSTNPQTLNRYAYTGNNPVNNIDPTGHMYYSVSAGHNGGEGGGFDHPDNSTDLPPEVQSKHKRLKEVLKQRRERRQQKRAPKPPRALTQKEINEGMASAAKHGPLTPPSVAVYRSAMATLLEVPKCADFANSLMGGLAKLSGQSLESTDPLQIFDEVASQGGISYDPTYISSEGGHTVGTIFTEATMVFTMIFYDSWLDGGLGLHETAHAVGGGDHTMMAQLAHDLAKNDPRIADSLINRAPDNPPIPSNHQWKARDAWASGVFEHILFNACGTR